MGDILAVIILGIAIGVGMRAVEPEGFTYALNNQCYRFKINTKNDKKINFKFDNWECDNDDF